MDAHTTHTHKIIYWNVRQPHTKHHTPSQYSVFRKIPVQDKLSLHTTVRGYCIFPMMHQNKFSPYSLGPCGKQTRVTGIIMNLTAQSLLYTPKSKHAVKHPNSLPDIPQMPLMNLGTH